MKQSGGAESGLVLFLNLGIFDENVDLDHRTVFPNYERKEKITTITMFVMPLLCGISSLYQHVIHQTLAFSPLSENKTLIRNFELSGTPQKVQKGVETPQMGVPKVVFGVLTKL